MVKESLKDQLTGLVEDEDGNFILPKELIGTLKKRVEYTTSDASKSAAERSRIASTIVRKNHQDEYNSIMSDLKRLQDGNIEIPKNSDGRVNYDELEGLLAS